MHFVSMTTPEAKSKAARAKSFGFCSSAGYVLAYDDTKSVASILDHLLQQAAGRQRLDSSADNSGAMLTRLIAAHLELVLGEGKIVRRELSFAGRDASRADKFVVNDVCVYVTTAPSEALMRSCDADLDVGLRPLIVTIAIAYPDAISLASVQGLMDRIDIFEAGQFVATSTHITKRLEATPLKVKIERLVLKYNEIIESCEADPGLKIRFET